MAFNIVLIEPEIHTNTGNIGRLSLATGSHLHLVKPLGFELDDKRLKRAGLDYWPHISLRVYDSQVDFFEQNKLKRMVFFSSKAKQTHWSIDFEDDLFLIFGKESVGLDSALIQSQEQDTYKIPLYSEHIRSLNLANAVATVVYEGLRQLQQ